MTIFESLRLLYIRQAYVLPFRVNFFSHYDPTIALVWCAAVDNLNDCMHYELHFYHSFVE